MPKPKKTPVNHRAEILNEVMRGMEQLLPPWESGSKDGFEMVEHPDALKDLWKIANKFPPISLGVENASKRRAFYREFSQAVKTKGGFRKGGATNAKIWSKVQSDLKKLEETN